MPTYPKRRIGYKIRIGRVTESKKLDTLRKKRTAQQAFHHDAQEGSKQLLKQLKILCEKTAGVFR